MAMTILQDAHPIEARAAISVQTDGAQTDDALAEVRGLSVAYGTGGTRAVDDVSFRIRTGQRVALVGESGSGKTTLAMAFAGFLPSFGVCVTAERMSFAGNDLLARKVTRLPRRTPGISMVFQDAMTSLDPIWTVGSQLTSLIRTVGRLDRREAKDEARRWLTKVGLTETVRVMKARPYELSGGMRQRVMMALALCSSPRLLIADEPTSALDASLSRGAMDLIVELTEQVGTALLVVSHDLNLCLEFTDRVMVMYQGRIVEQADSATVAAHAQHPYTRALLACIPTLDSVSADRLPTLEDFLPAAGLPGPRTELPADTLQLADV